MSTENKTDIVNDIMDYESGQMDSEREIEFFQRLIDTGTIRHLQGHYHRVAEYYLQAGLIHL